MTKPNLVQPQLHIGIQDQRSSLNRLYDLVLEKNSKLSGTQTILAIFLSIRRYESKDKKLVEEIAYIYNRHYGRGS